VGLQALETFCVATPSEFGRPSKTRVRAADIEHIINPVLGIETRGLHMVRVPASGGIGQRQAAERLMVQVRPV